jgi:hypothetical protein
MSKIHLICGTSSSGSDEDEYLLCELELEAPNCTYYKEFVDCKKCLKRMTTRSKGGSE